MNISNCHHLPGSPSAQCHPNVEWCDRWPCRKGCCGHHLDPYDFLISDAPLSRPRDYLWQNLSTWMGVEYKFRYRQSVNKKVIVKFVNCAISSHGDDLEEWNHGKFGHYSENNIPLISLWRRYWDYLVTQAVFPLFISYLRRISLKRRESKNTSKNTDTSGLAT